MSLDSFQTRRIKRGIPKRYNECRSLCKEARETLDLERIYMRAWLERIAMHRDAIADARRALETDSTVAPTSKHYDYVCALLKRR